MFFPIPVDPTNKYIKFIISKNKENRSWFSKGLGSKIAK